MAVLHDYRCMVHGKFESREARCPYGCDTVERVFEKAPAFGRVAGGIDRTLNHIAAKNGLTNMSNSNGKSVGENARAAPVQDPFGELKGSYKDSAGGMWMGLDKKSKEGIAQQIGNDPRMSMASMLGHRDAAPKPIVKGRQE